MEEMKRWQIPAFGNWEQFNEMPSTQFFDYASEQGLIRTGLFGEEDLFKVPVAIPVKSACPYGNHCRRQSRKASGAGVKKRCSMEQKQMKQGRVCEATACTPRRRGPMAVDEDLYKIPPELLYPKPNRKRLLRTLLSACMGLNCIR